MSGLRRSEMADLDHKARTCDNCKAMFCGDCHVLNCPFCQKPLPFRNKEAT